MPLLRLPQGNRLLIVLSITTAALVLMPALIALRMHYEVRTSLGEVSETLKVDKEIKALLIALVDAETGQRGFLLTGRPQYLEPYHRGVAEVPAKIELLGTLTAGHSKERPLLDRLKPDVDRKLGFMSRAVELMQQGHDAEAREPMSRDEGKKSMDEIRGILGAMAEEEQKLLAQHQTRLAHDTERANAFLWVLFAICAVCAGVIIVLLKRLAEAESVVKMCAWSSTVEFQGEWISFDEYLRRRFKIDTTHGISPIEAEKLRAAHAMKKKAA
jgi:CHASE3 domain sensor protein